MRSVLSKGGGNVSLAGECRHEELFTGTKPETMDNSQEDESKSSFCSLANNRMTGGPSRGGIRRV